MTLVTVLGIFNTIMLLALVFIIWLTVKRHRRHKITMVFIRMSRMNPVSCIKANKKTEWIAIGRHNLGYDIGSAMPWEEEMILLDKFFENEIGAIKKRYP